MTVVASGSVNPETIITGQSIRVFDSSTSSLEDIVASVIYINELKACTMAAGSQNIMITNASTYFTIGDTVVWNSGQPLPFVNFSSIYLQSVTYYVVLATSTYIRLSLTRGGPAITCTVVGASPGLFMGGESQYPSLRPFPVAAAISRNVIIYAFGSSGANDSEIIPFYTTITASTKPVATSTFARLSIFIYNATDATVLNRLWTTNFGFLFTDLKFTGSINKAGTASFVVTGKGSQTAIEEGLLLSDNYVAIIAGESVVWSGKILRSEQSKMSLFAVTSSVKQWDVECESDLGKMRFQNIKPANKGIITGSIGTIVSKVLEGVSPAINWNGTTNDPALRSNEGPSITYTISEADMFSQLTTLRGVIDFDMRTRLTYQRYHYNSYNSGSGVATVTSVSPYAVNAFAAKWVLFITTGVGVTSYGKCFSNAINSISVVSVKNPTFPSATGTLLVLGDPVLDFVSDLSQSSKQATFYMNAPRTTTPSYGYEFDDKTDRKLLATKVIAKGKNTSGDTISTTIAAVTPWDYSKSSFENTTTITHRTEGIIVQITDGIAPAGSSTLWIDGWGYIMSQYDYLAIKHPLTTGAFILPNYFSRVTSVPVETKIGDRRVTQFTVPYTAYLGPGGYLGGTVFVVKASEVDLTLPYDSNYGSLYIKDYRALGYASGMDVYISGETIHTLDLQTDPVYGYRIRYIITGAASHREQASASTGAHIPGSTVWKGSLYSETSPVPGSPVYYHGIILQTYTADQNVSIPTLEIYTTMYLTAYSYYYRKATFWCPVYDFFRTDSREQYQLTSASFLQPGDKISCLPKSTDTETDQIYGQLKNIWQIVSFTVDANSLQVTVDLGDFERNVFTLLADKTASINATIT